MNMDYSLTQALRKCNKSKKSSTTMISIAASGNTFWNEFRKVTSWRFLKPWNFSEESVFFMFMVIKTSAS